MLAILAAMGRATCLLLGLILIDCKGSSPAKPVAVASQPEPAQTVPETEPTEPTMPTAVVVLQLKRWQAEPQVAMQRFARPWLVSSTLKELRRPASKEDVARVAEHLALVHKPAAAVEGTFVGRYEEPSAADAMRLLEVHARRFVDAEQKDALKVLVVEVETLAERLAKAEKTLETAKDTADGYPVAKAASLPKSAQPLYIDLIKTDETPAKTKKSLQRLTGDLAKTEAHLRDLPRFRREYAALVDSASKAARVHGNIVDKLAASEAARKKAEKEVRAATRVVSPPVLRADEPTP